MKNYRKNKSALMAVLGFCACNALAQNDITLDKAINLAWQNDPWHQGNRLKQQAIENMSIASGQLDDPRVTVSMMNLPTDNWDLDKEGMTQLKVGVSQMLPRGETLAIKKRQLKIKSTQYPLLAENRKAMLKRQVSQIWLDAYLAQQSIALIKTDWVLFEQMAEVAKASYSNVIGKTRQHDVIRAQLEIVQLEDKLAAEQQALEVNMARLNEWLQVYDDFAAFDSAAFDSAAFDMGSQPIQYNVSKQLPAIKLINQSIFDQSILDNPNYSINALAAELFYHPAILVIDVKQKVAEEDILLSKEQYRPQWGINASYGLRDNMPNGDSRSDLVSLGVSFDLPIFTDNKQDKQVAAKVAASEAVKTEKLLLAKKMIAAVDKEFRQLKWLSQRQDIYQDKLLKQTHDQAEASLTAYTNDDGDFAEVVRARIAQLNARISALKIDVEKLKTIVRINYFFTRSSTQLKANQQFGTNLQYGDK